MVEELYHGTGDSGTRIAVQLEEERAKRKFFGELTEKMRFEYTVQPSALALSAGAVALIGLPHLTVDPPDSADLMAVISPDLVPQIRERLKEMTADESYFELGSEIVIGGKPRWFQLAVMVTWSVAEPGRCSSITGQIRNITLTTAA